MKHAVYGDRVDLEEKTHYLSNYAVSLTNSVSFLLLVINKLKIKYMPYPEHQCCP
jgi:hypothetical protein